MTELINLNPIIIKELSTIAYNVVEINNYIDIIYNYINNPPIANYDKHHILPKSVFPKYKNLSKFAWNKVLLPYDIHLECHKILSNITDEISLKKAFWYMSNIPKYQEVNQFDVSYMDARKHVINDKIGKMVARDTMGKAVIVSNTDNRLLTNELVPLSKGKISVKDKHGATFQVNKEDPRYLSGELVGVANGTVMVKNKNGDVFRVASTDTRYTSGELTSISKGKVIVKDIKGNALSVDIGDERYTSGSLTGINTGKIVVKDSNGKKLRVDKNDPRFLEGEFVGIAKNKVSVKDSSGNIFRVDKDDPRFLNGELTGVMKGKGWYNNGVVSKRFYCDEIPSGFVKGRLKK